MGNFQKSLNNKKAQISQQLTKSSVVSLVTTLTIKATILAAPYFPVRKSQ